MQCVGIKLTEKRLTNFVTSQKGGMVNAKLKKCIIKSLLGYQLPWVMPNYPSDTLDCPFLRGNVATQMPVMVKK